MYKEGLCKFDQLYSNNYNCTINHDSENCEITISTNSKKSVMTTNALRMTTNIPTDNKCTHQFREMFTDNNQTSI